MFPDSKATALIENLLAPHSVQIIKQEIQKIPFYGISTDSSNHKHMKLFSNSHPLFHGM